MQKLNAILLGVIIILLVVFHFTPMTSRLGDAGTGNRFTAMTVSGSTLSNATGVVLAKNGGRQYARFQNDDGTINEWLCLAATCSANTGIKLTAGQSYVMDLTNLYVGDVSAIAASGTPVMDITTNP